MGIVIENRVVVTRWWRRFFFQCNFFFYWRLKNILRSFCEGYAESRLESREGFQQQQKVSEKKSFIFDAIISLIKCKRRKSKRGERERVEREGWKKAEPQRVSGESKTERESFSLIEKYD